MNFRAAVSKFLTHFNTEQEILDSSVGIAGYGPDARSSVAGRSKTVLSFTDLGSTAAPTQPPIKWVMVATSSEVKRPGQEAETHLHIVPR